MLNDGELTQKIIGAAMRVHRQIGSGFQEHIYHRALVLSLVEIGLKVETEKEFIVTFANKFVGKFRVDLVVESQVIVELKSTAALISIHLTQTISYLKASGLEIGLLLNFGTRSLQIKRLAKFV